MIRDLMNDDEWAFFEPFLIETGPKRGRPPRDHRLVLDGVFWSEPREAAIGPRPVANAHWSHVARPARSLLQMGLGLPAIPTLDDLGPLGIAA